MTGPHAPTNTQSPDALWQEVCPPGRSAIVAVHLLLLNLYNLEACTPAHYKVQDDAWWAAWRDGLLELLTHAAGATALQEGRQSLCAYVQHLRMEALPPSARMWLGRFNEVAAVTAVGRLTDHLIGTNQRCMLCAANGCRHANGRMYKSLGGLLRFVRDVVLQAVDDEGVGAAVGAATGAATGAAVGATVGAATGEAPKQKRKD